MMKQASHVKDILQRCTQENPLSNQQIKKMLETLCHCVDDLYLESCGSRKLFTDALGEERRITDQMNEVRNRDLENQLRGFRQELQNLLQKNDRDIQETMSKLKVSIQEEVELVDVKTSGLTKELLTLQQTIKEQNLLLTKNIQGLSNEIFLDQVSKFHKLSEQIQGFSEKLGQIQETTESQSKALSSMETKINQKIEYICSTTTLKKQLALKKYIIVFIRDIHGKTVQIDTHLDLSVQSLKQRLTQKMGYPTYNYFLAKVNPKKFSVKVLPFYLTLSECQVYNGERLEQLQAFNSAVAG